MLCHGRRASTVHAKSAFIGIDTKFNAEKYTPALVSALSNPSPTTLYHDEKTRTAIGLFSDIQRETFPRSRFLTCIIALEVLASPLRKHCKFTLPTLDKQRLA